MTDLIKKVEKNIAELGLINKGDKILVALSGGPDSTALLHILHRLKRRLKFSLAACYINHKIRPRAVKKEIEFCRLFCAEFKVSFSVMETDIPTQAAELKLSLEETGHRFRKEALSYMAGELECNKIALGHHLDDLVETVLFRIIRGTGPQGLDPLKPLENGRIRPLYNISRNEIEAYLAENNIEAMLDRSNLKSNYSRNYLRNKVIPPIEKHFGARYRSSIFTFTRILSDENRFLDSLARKEIKKSCYRTPGGKIFVDLKMICRYDVWLRRRIVKLILEIVSGRRGAGSFEEINRILDLIDGRTKALNLADSINAASDRNQLIFFKGKVGIKKSPIDLNGTTKLEGIDIKIKCSSVASGKTNLKRLKGGHKIYVDYDKLNFPLYVRGIRPGDSFSPLGMTKTKKLGDYLTDKKILKYIRDEIPVICDQEGIVWLVGHQISNRVKIDQTTTKALTIESHGNEIAGIT